MLGLFNICASNINIQQEAQSKIQMESWVGMREDSIAIEKADVQLINSTTYLIKGNGIIVAETISEVENNDITYVVFKGAELRRYTLVPHVNAKLEATSELIADETPIGSLDIRLEGESTANVWVTDLISGKGEGKSSLVYRGSPSIQYTTQGEATIQAQ